MRRDDHILCTSQASPAKRSNSEIIRGSFAIGCSSLRLIRPKYGYHRLQTGETKRKKSNAASLLLKLFRKDIGIAGKSSSKHLLESSDLFGDSQDLDNNKDRERFDLLKESKPVFSSLPQTRPFSDQVIVLRVSLHCKGCEGKVRKHLSKMQGVTSFNIDFEANKVTVTGDVNALEVLSSISKVKSAQLWTTSRLKEE